MTIDCCYSGHWCFKAKELYDSGSPLLHSFREIEIQTSTDPDHKAVWGAYSNLSFPTLSSKRHCEKAKMYKEEYGMTHWVNDEEVQCVKGYSVVD